MNENQKHLSDYERLIISLKDKPAASPEKRIPEWILKCECRFCKRFRKNL